jgi:hypothetical protein
MYGAHTLKGDTAAYGCGTIVAAIWTHGPTRGLISSHCAAPLPQLDQVCFTGGINGYNTVPLGTGLAHFTYKNAEFQTPKASQLEQISKIWSYKLKFITNTTICMTRSFLTFFVEMP